MNYKPDEATIVSYLYGTLEEKEKARVEKYFQENVEMLSQAKEMANARDILGSLKDKEVIAPPVFVNDRSNVMTAWQSPYFKTAIGIAASFLVLMIAARLIGVEIRYTRGELSISFGGTKKEIPMTEPAVPASGAGLTPEAVRTMINTAVQKNNESIAADWADREKQINHTLRRGLDLNSKKVDDIMKTASVASQEQVRSFVAGLQQDNLRLMKDYLQLSSTEQQKYVESLLVDFSKYLQEQRNQDLTLFQTRMNSIESNSNQFKQETEQILSSIISTPKVTKMKNSY